MKGNFFLNPLSLNWWTYQFTKVELKKEVRRETRKMEELREHRRKEDRLDASRRKLNDGNKDTL